MQIKKISSSLCGPLSLKCMRMRYWKKSLFRHLRQKDPIFNYAPHFGSNQSLSHWFGDIWVIAVNKSETIAKRPAALWLAVGPASCHAIHPVVWVAVCTEGNLRADCTPSPAALLYIQQIVIAYSLSANHVAATQCAKVMLYCLSIALVKFRANIKAEGGWLKGLVCKT